MNIQAYYQPQDNGEYMYIETDKDKPGSAPLKWPEYFDTLLEVELRHRKSNNTIPMEIMPYIQRLS